MSLTWLKIPILFSTLVCLEIIIMTGEPMQTASEALCTQVYQLSSEKQSNHYTSLPAAFNPLPPSMDRKILEKQLCNQSS